MSLSLWNKNNVIQLSADNEGLTENIKDFPLLLNISNDSGNNGYDCSELFTALDYTDVNDDFTGTDGIKPNTALWSAKGIHSFISSNRLRQYINNTINTVYTESNYVLRGDFDIQVDFESNFTYQTANDRYSVILAVYDGTNMAYIGRYIDVDGPIRASTPAGSWSGGSTSYNSGTLRIVRVGTTLDLYYYDSGWVKAYSDTAFTTADLQVLLRTATWLASTIIDSYFDNFTVNSGTVHWPNGTFPNRKKIAVQYKGSQEHYVSIADDDFTGADGDTPNSYLWSDVSSGVWTINNNRLKVVSDSWDVLQSNYKLVGDFDIQIDFDCSESQSVNDRFTRLWLTDDNTVQHYIGQGYVNSGLYYVSNSYEGSWATRQDTTTADTSGKFRLVRSDTAITAYYWNGTGWTAQVSYTYSNAPAMYVRLVANITTGNSTDYFDNFTVTKGNLDWLGNTPNPDKTFVTNYAIDTQQCYCEIDYWDQTAQSAQIWCRVPLLLKDQPTDLLLYYDATQDDNNRYIGDTGDGRARQVWSESGRLVYHFSQDPSVGGACLLDSTKEADGTPTGAVNLSNLVSGKIGKALYLDGSGDYVTMGAPVTTYPTATHSIWFSTADNTLTRQYLTTVQANPPQTATYTFQERQGAYIETNICSAQYYTGGTTVAKLSCTSTVDANVWNQLTLTVGPSGGKLYLNGVMEDSDATAPVTASTNQKLIGARLDAQGDDYFKGSIGNVIIADSEYSESRVYATYKSESDTLLTYSSAKLYTVSGYVKEVGSPKQRTVYLYDRQSGELMDKTVSDLSGYYSVYSTTSGIHNIVCLDNDAAPDYNDVMLSKVNLTEVV